MIPTVANTVLCTPNVFMFKLKQGEENMFLWNNPQLKHWLCAFYFCDELSNPISEWRRISISKTHGNAMRLQYTGIWKSATSSFWHKTTWIVLEFYCTVFLPLLNFGCHPLPQNKNHVFFTLFYSSKRRSTDQLKISSPKRESPCKETFVEISYRKT